MAEKKNKGGRPSKYTEELGEYICDKIAVSTCSLKKLCESDPKLPHQDTVLVWVNKHEEFHRKYDKAKRRQAEFNAQHLEQIAEETPTYIDEKGVERIDPGIMARQRLLLDTKKWQASKLAPKIYGDKQHIAVEESSNTEELKQEILKLRAKLDEKNAKDY